MQLLGDGLFKIGSSLHKQESLTPAPPRNTRASFRLSPCIQRSSGKSVESSLQDSRDCDTIKKTKDVELENMLVMENGVQLTIPRGEEIAGSPVEQPSRKREKLMMRRVTVPRERLRKLKIENHCKNSMPSHQLQDIQMQPIDGTGQTPSSGSSASLVGDSSREMNEDTDRGQESMFAEAPLSDKDGEMLLKAVAADQTLLLDDTSRLTPHW